MSEREETLWRVWERRAKLPPAAKCYLKRIALLPEEDTHTLPRCHARLPPVLWVARRPTLKKAAHRLRLCPSRALRVVVVHVRRRSWQHSAPSLLPRCNCEYHPPTQKGWAMLSCMEEGLKNYFITTHVISALVASTSTKTLTYGKTC